MIILTGGNFIKTKQLEKINMLNDYLFKALFRSIEAREMVSSFISSITDIPKEDLMNADYQGGELPKKNLKEKGKASDIIIKIDDGNKIILEMNQYKSDKIFEKNTSYVFSIASETILSKTKKYPRVILINFDNFNYFKTDKEILNFKLRDEYGHIETNQYHSIHLILENIVNSEYNKNTDIKKLTKLLKTNTIQEMESEFKGDEKYMACIRKVEDLSTDPNFVGYYDIEEARRQDLEDMKETGLREGFEKGSEEKQLEIAKKLLSIRMPVDEICMVTGLSPQEMENKFKIEEDYMACVEADSNLVGYYDIEEARRQDLEDMKEIGLREGFEKGVEQGSKEKQLEIAKNLLSLNISIEDICKATGLSIEGINNLKD